MTTRDLRDPAELGDTYLRFRAGGMAIEDAVRIPVPDFAHASSTATETVAEYKQQMVEAAAEGDVAAGDVCEEKGWAYAIPPRDDAPVSVSVTAGLTPAEIEELPGKQCRSTETHAPHAWSDVPMPGTRASVTRPWPTAWWSVARW